MRPCCFSWLACIVHSRTAVSEKCLRVCRSRTSRRPYPPPRHPSRIRIPRHLHLILHTTTSRSTRPLRRLAVRRD
ncbi:hypothetical protein C8R45DRAFT_1019120, partial [Mycena sanguinolenta]